MIITRAPFRVSFCGGGSDLPDFYEKYGGCVLSTTIRKYMYLTAHSYFEKDQIVLKYSKTEKVTDFSQIEHRIFKQCLTDFQLKGVEISSMADIPAESSSKLILFPDWFAKFLYLHRTSVFCQLILGYIFTCVSVKQVKQRHGKST